MHKIVVKIHLLLEKIVLFAGRLKLINEWCQTYTKSFKIWLGPAILWIFVNDPRIIQKILLSQQILEKPFFYKFLRLENGLISAKCNVALKLPQPNWIFHNLLIFQSMFGKFTENRSIIHSTWKFCSPFFQYLLRTRKIWLIRWWRMRPPRRNLISWTAPQNVPCQWFAVRILFPFVSL